ncbi:putative protein isoform X2 [Capsicum chacoense]|uniref:uncharacterized protein LOC107857697 isoform X2 n=1 Tax=Capsicum annuum TaxID=4072 RepID=UPI001FB1951C|nr:uncharacterized protein LOC107857697 isoform X2 [Capsicum annuum]
MALDDKRDDDKLSNHDGDSKERLDLFLEQGLSVLQTVYSGSIKALPSSFSLRTQFLEIVEATNLAHSEDMRNEILADMKRDFSKEPKYWDWLVRQEVIDLNNPESTEAVTADQLSRAIQLEKVDEAKALAAKFCYGKFSAAVWLWALRFSIEMIFIQSNCTPNKAVLSSFFEPLRNVLLEVPISEAETI